MKKNLLLAAFLYGYITNMSAQYWSALGSGIGSASFHTVSSLVAYNGELYTGGNFTTAGNVNATNIAKWNGNSWSAVSQGVNGSLRALTVYNNELYAGGSFSVAGDVTAHGIARWNGSGWSNTGSIQSNITAMAVHNGALYAAGGFSNLDPNGTVVAKWDGNNWTSVLPQDSFYTIGIECMAAYNGELYAAGAYMSGGGAPAFFRIMKWDGTNWAVLVTIAPIQTYDGALGNIYSMTVYNNELYVAGSFYMIDSIETYQIAKWNGVSWSAVGSGINPERYPFGGDSDGAAYSFVGSLAEFDGALYAGGHFDSCGMIETRNIAKWDGMTWSALGQGVNDHVYAIAPIDSTLYVGGWFDAVNGNSILANKIAKWTSFCPTTLSQPTVINGNEVVCSGTTQTYSVNAVPGALSYSWSIPHGWTGNSDSNIITVTSGTNGGIISVTANNTCDSSLPQSLYVDVVLSAPSQPAIIYGNDTVCAGSIQTYFINPVPGATGYSWDLSFGTAVVINDVSFTVNVSHSESSDHIVSVVAYNSCGFSDIQVLPVSVVPVPWIDKIFGNAKVCRGSTQTYFTQVTGATGFIWTLPPGWTGSSVSNSITVIAGSNSGTVSVKANNNCGISNEQTIAILVDTLLPVPPEISGNIYTSIGLSENYSLNTVNGFVNYTWSVSGGGTFTTGQDGKAVNIIWTSPGVYILSVNAKNSCGNGATQSVTINVADGHYDPYNLQIFPNPSSGELNLSAKRTQDKTISVEIRNALGQVIYKSEKFMGTNNFLKQLSIHRYPHGLYFVKIMSDEVVYTRRIVLIRQ
jgi:hypothetical protein